MNIQKQITLMGDRINLLFFVEEDDLFTKDRVMMWFQDTDDNFIDIGDNYDYFQEEANNKEEIKQNLKNVFIGEKGLYKELKALMQKMNEYRK